MQFKAACSNALLPQSHKSADSLQFTGGAAKAARRQGWGPKVQGWSMILPSARCAHVLFTGGGGTKKHEVETQSASLGRDFAIHKVLPLLITGGWGHQRGGVGILTLH